MMNLYHIEFDCQNFYVAAPDFTAAIDAWQQWGSEHWKDEWEGTEQPESVQRIGARVEKAYKLRKDKAHRFTLKEQWEMLNRGKLSGSVKITGNGQLEIQLDGFGDKTSADGHGTPILIELYKGSPRILVWADINREGPTHDVNLSTAAETQRNAARGR